MANKNRKNRHLPPTGRKCQFKSAQKDSETNGLRDAAVASESLATDQDQGRHRIQMKILDQLKNMSQRLDLVEDQVAATAQQTGVYFRSGHWKVE